MGKNRRRRENLNPILSSFFYKNPLCFVKSSVTMAIKKGVELVCLRLFTGAGAAPVCGPPNGGYSGGGARAAAVCERGVWICREPDFQIIRAAHGSDLTATRYMGRFPAAGKAGEGRQLGGQSDVRVNSLIPVDLGG